MSQWSSSYLDSINIPEIFTEPAKYLDSTVLSLFTVC